MAPDPGPLWNHRVGQQRSIGVTLPLNYSRALRRPSGQSGPSPRGVGNETDFQKKKKKQPEALCGWTSYLYHGVFVHLTPHLIRARTGGSFVSRICHLNHTSYVRAQVDLSFLAVAI